MTELSKPDLVQQGMDRLPSYWDDKPLARGLLQALLQTFQNPLDLIFEVLNGTSLADAEGVQLNIIGKLWDVARGLSLDDDYRIAISQAISNSTVDSTPERIYEIMKVASNATQLELTDYPAHVYLYLNVGVVETLKELALTTKAAGVDINLAFPPIEDGKSVSMDEAWDYSNATLYSTDVLDWGTADCTVTNEVSTLTGLTEAVALEDTSAIAAGVADQIEIIVTEPDDILSASYFLKKDTTNDIRTRLVVSTSSSSIHFIFRVDPSNGDFIIDTTLNLDSYNFCIEDVGDYYFIKFDLESTYDLLATTSVTLQFFPAYSVSLGSSDVTLVTSNVVTQPSVRVLSGYTHIVSTSTGLRCSELLSEEYFLVDDAGDFIIDDISDFIIVESGFLYLSGAEPLGLPCSIKLSQPCTEVI